MIRFQPLLLTLACTTADADAREALPDTPGYTAALAAKKNALLKECPTRLVAIGTTDLIPHLRQVRPEIWIPK